MKDSKLPIVVERRETFHNSLSEKKELVFDIHRDGNGITDLSMDEIVFIHSVLSIILSKKGGEV